MNTAAYPPESSEASHLRHLLEKQPSCLLRVSRTGMLLACNEAGLSLLGHDELSEVLNRAFEDYLSPEQAAEWREFAERVWDSGAGSFECQLTTKAAGVRAVQLQGIALRDHPDAVESLLVTARDTSSLHRLERSLQTDSPGHETVAQLEAALVAARHELQELHAAVQARQTERDRADAALRQAEALLAIERAAAHKLTDAEDQLAAAMRDRRQIAVELAESEAEQRRLAADLDTGRTERDRLAEEHRRELARIQQLAEHHQLVALENERSGRERAAALERQLANAAAEHERLSRLLDDHLASGTEAQLSAERRDQRIAELERELSSLRASERRLTDVVESLDRERQQAADTVARRESEWQKELAAAREEAAAARERDRRLVVELESQLIEATAGQQHATALAQDLDARLQQALVDHSTVRTEMGRALAESLERSRSETETAVDEAVARVRAAAAADARRDAARIDELETELRAATSDRDAVRRQMEAALAETQERYRSAAEAELQNALAQAREQAAAAEALATRRARDLEQRVVEIGAERDAVRAELDGALAAVADAKRAAAADAQRAAASIAELENRVAEAHVGRDRLRDELTKASTEGHARDEALAQALAQNEALAQARSHAAQELDRIRATVADLEAAHDEANAERDKVIAERERAIADRDKAIADATVAKADLERALADARESSQAHAAEQQERDRRALENLRIEYADALAERTRVGELVEELTAELRRVTSEHDATRAQMERTIVETRAEATRRHDRDRQALADADARYAQAIVEQDRLLEALAQEQTERGRLEAERAAMRADVERQATDEYQRALAARDRQRNELVANLQAELALASADQKRLQTLLARAEAERQKLAASHAADRAELERSLGEAMLGRSHAAKQLADERVELKHWRDAVSELEPVAAAGRLALQLARELREVMSALDERTRLLLDVSRLDAGYRPIVEALRADAMRTILLARRLSRVELTGSAAATAGDASSPTGADRDGSDREESR